MTILLLVVERGITLIVQGAVLMLAAIMKTVPMVNVTRSVALFGKNAPNIGTLAQRSAARGRSTNNTSKGER